MDAGNAVSARASEAVTKAVRCALRGRNAAAVPAFAVVMALSISAHAQSQSQTPASGSRSISQTLEEVIVTGIRQSLESAQEIKQNAEEVVDSVTAQDIGALPDRSVSEALQRIPGITLQRTSANRDPARLASEGGGVFIRGLSSVRSELNGRDVFSANNGRDLSFEDVSSDLLAAIDVYKNPSAEHVEGGIGGIVNLRTRRPFDSEQSLLAFSADYNYADLMEEGFVSGNALFSDQWEVGGGRLGALLSASIGNIGNRTDSIQTGRFEPRTLSATDAALVGMPAGAEVFVPNSVGWRRIDWEQERRSYAATLQWQPSDALVMTLQGFYAEANPVDVERAFGDTDGGYQINNTWQFDEQNVLAAGRINDFKTTIDTRYGEQDKNTGDYSLNVNFQPNDNWALSADVQYIESHADVYSMTAFTQLSPPFTTFDFDLRGDTPFMSVNSPRQGDQSAYWWAAAMDHLEDNDAQSYAERLDAEYTFDDNPWLKSFRVGARATQKDAITRQTGWNWGYLSQQFWCQGCNPAAFLNDASLDARLPGATEFFAFDNFFRGDVNIPAGGFAPTEALIRNGNVQAFDLLRQTQRAGWGWTPLTKDFANTTLHGDNGNRGINDQTEETVAGYGVLRFGHDSPLGPMDGNIGVRLVRTETVTGATPGVQVRAGNATNTSDPNSACPATENCTWWNTAVAFINGFGQVETAVTESSYTDVLPTLNVRFLLTPELQLRFAAGKAIVRPTFSQMQGSTLLTFDNTGFQPKSGIANNGIVGYGGNPELKPTRSTQFDTSLEWYFDAAGSLTFAAFYKDIEDYIFTGRALETYTAGGQSVAFEVTRNLNGASGRIKGMELAYQQFYTGLPGLWGGLGLQANFTYVDSSGGKNTALSVFDTEQTTNAADDELPLEGLSKTSYNFAVIYEKYDISARLAYSWRERYLLTTSAANINRPVWFDDYGQLDGSVFYSITPQVKVGLQGTNLLNTRSFLDVGGSVFAPRYSWTDTDRRIALAVRTSF
jgi:TonB-dependent receptor